VTVDLETRRGLVRRIPALASLDDARVDALVPLLSERVVPEGTTFVHQGDDAHEAYLVTSGKVEVLTDGVSMATLGPGAVVGEVALLVGGPRMSSVRSITEVELLVVDAEAFSALLDHPEVARTLAGELAQRLRAVPAGEATGQTDAKAWNSLTPAEQQVARLVADGLTNGQVAEQLFLSKHTVESHLKHIFTKLGITSRVALAVDIVPKPKPPRRATLRAFIGRGLRAP
jgi:CRP-like cAMP-binding protein